MDNHPIVFLVLAIILIFKALYYAVILVWIILYGSYKLIVKLINRKERVDSNAIDR